MARTFISNFQQISWLTTRSHNVYLALTSYSSLLGSAPTIFATSPSLQFSFSASLTFWVYHSCRNLFELSLSLCYADSSIMCRLISGTFEIRFVDHIKQDIIDHRNDTDYDVMYLTPVPDSCHNFRVQIHDFTSLDFDDPSKWSQALLTAYAHFYSSSPLGVPFNVTRVCKPSCDRRHLTRKLQSAASSAPPLS